MIDEKLEDVYNDVLRRNPSEPEFHQAVREVLESLGAVISKHPELGRQKIIQRICEPERQIIPSSAVDGHMRGLAGASWLVRGLWVV